MFTGEQIKKRRKELGLSAQELADILRVKKDSIYKWEKGTRPNNAEEYLRVESWLRGKLENVPHETYHDMPTIAKEDQPEITRSNQTMQALFNLTESNLNISESNKSIARSNEELVAIIKGNQLNSTDQRTMAEMSAIVIALRETVNEIFAAVKSVPLAEAKTVFRKKVKSALDSGNKDSRFSDGN